MNMRRSTNATSVLRSMLGLALITLLALSATAQQDRVSDEFLSVEAYRTVEKKAEALADKEVAEQFADEIAALEIIKKRVKLKDRITVVKAINGQVVEGVLYGMLDRGDLFAQIGDQRVRVPDLRESDQIRLKHVQMTEKEVQADLADREEDLQKKMQQRRGVIVKQHIDRVYPNTFREDTLLLNDRFYYLDTLGHQWYKPPVRVSFVPEEQDPFGEFLVVLFPENKMKVDAQIVVKVGDKVVGTSFRGEAEPELTNAKWANLRVYVKRSDLLGDTQEDPLSSDEAMRAVVKNLKLTAYAQNVGHWDFAINRLPVRYLGKTDVAALVLLVNRESAVDAKGRVFEENKTFVEAAKAGVAYQADIANKMQAALAKAAALQQELEEKRERERLENQAAEERRQQEAAILAILSEQTDEWFTAQNLPKTEHLVTLPYNTSDKIGRGRTAEFPVEINDEEVVKASDWVELRHINERDREKNYRYVGMKYRFIQLKVDPDESPRFLIQTALYFINSNRNAPIRVTPRLTVHIREPMQDDRVPKDVEVDPTIVITSAHELAPAWNGHLVSTRPISIYQLYRGIGDIDFEMHPKADVPDIPEDDVPEGDTTGDADAGAMTVGDATDEAG